MSDDKLSAIERLQARREGRDSGRPTDASGAKPTIVAVDDEKGNLDAIQRVLGDRFELSLFEDGPSALAHVREVGCPDLLITDQRMAGMTGVEFLSEVVSSYVYATGIILSGYTERADLIGAINQSHVFAYVTKPWQPAVLLETIEGALEMSVKRRDHAARSDRMHSISARLEKLDDSSDTEDFLAGFDDLEAELDALSE